ncbi:hypothetical protein [Sphaerisporangium aureirubrum]|uniref:Uncharacterized protein n=1 Tax=Sphaerisporangium aureirubrum TaxID=1544736 RepID=A0ABW1NXT8_9ACTN
MSEQVRPDQISVEQRQQILAEEIRRAVAAGYRTESSTTTSVVLVKGKRVNHLLHLVLSVLTAGVWIIVWIIVAVAGGEKRSSLLVDEFGNIQRG